MTASECLEHKWLKDEAPLMQTISNDIRIVATENRTELNGSPFDDRVNDLNSSSIVTTSTASATRSTSTSSSSEECCKDNLNEINKNNGGLFELKIVNNIESPPKSLNHTNNASIVNINSLQPSSNSSSIIIMKDNNNKDEDKENILVTNYSNKTREMNLIIEEKRDENRLICEKLYINNSHNSNNNNNNNNHNSSMLVVTPRTATTTTATAIIHLFPDAPTTPKVCRKGPSDTSPSVQALVKKFQDCDKQLAASTTSMTNHQNLDNNFIKSMPSVTSSVTISSNPTSSPSSTTTTTTTQQTSNGRCSCLTSPSCRHFNGRKSIGGIDQGISIC